ncbi:hypothetical protein S7335_3168 [Synechococcus sp. PCC 7335]|nr:hypothetical protein S7335_3168 [Synechococcus sp. PCC 7335]
MPKGLEFLKIVTGYIVYVVLEIVKGGDAHHRVIMLED